MFLFSSARYFNQKQFSFWSRQAKLPQQPIDLCLTRFRQPISESRIVAHHNLFFRFARLTQSAAKDSRRRLETQHTRLTSQSDPTPIARCWGQLVPIVLVRDDRAGHSVT